MPYIYAIYNTTTPSKMCRSKMVQRLWYQSLTHGILRLIWKVLWMEKHFFGKIRCFTELRTLCGGTSEYENMGSGEGPGTRYFNKFLGIFRYSNVNPESLGWRVYGGILALTGISLDSRWEYCVNMEGSDSNDHPWLLQGTAHGEVHGSNAPREP